MKWLVVVVVIPTPVLGLEACGDDGNDVALRQLRADQFVAESRAWRASYVNTNPTGDSGISALDSTGGQIEHARTIASRAAGIHVGQCCPCAAVIDDVISSNNGLGYSGTNSGGNLLILNSVWYDNRVGVVPNSGSYELCRTHGRLIEGFDACAAV